MNGDGRAGPCLLIQLNTVMETPYGKEDVVKRIMIDSGDTFEDTVKAISEKVVRSYHAPLDGVLLSWDGGSIEIFGWDRDILEHIGSVKEGLL